MAHSRLALVILAVIAVSANAYQLIGNYDCAGSKYDVKHISGNLAKCQQECNKISNCKGIMMVPSKNYCWLKKDNCFAGKHKLSIARLYKKVPVTRAPATTKKIVPVIPTHGGNANGAPCVFPFIYRGKKYTECTKASWDGDTWHKHWCATVSNYDTMGKKWGHCGAGTTSAPTTKKPTTRRPTTQKATTKKIGYSAGSSVQGVFWLHKGRYSFNYNQAVAACRASGAQLASLAQLNVAYKAGMNQCNCGWTTDKKAHYPITQKKSLIWQCGGSKPGVRTCGWQKTWDAYCYRPVGYALGSQVKGVFWLHKGRYSFNYDQAVAACKAVGAQLASLAQLNNAYKGGMNQCNCGWTTDKKAHYPITQKKSLIWQCGGSKPGVRTCGWQKTWDAYCYRA